MVNLSVHVWSCRVFKVSSDHLRRFSSFSLGQVHVTSVEKIVVFDSILLKNPFLLQAQSWPCVLCSFKLLSCLARNVGRGRWENSICTFSAYLAYLLGWDPRIDKSRSLRTAKSPVDDGVRTSTARTMEMRHYKQMAGGHREWGVSLKLYECS